jgi:hypothetical protein
MRELERLLRIEAAARRLWNAHCESHDTRPSPQKYGMNYGPLVELGRALGVAPPSAPDGQQHHDDRASGDDQIDASL